MFLLFLLQLLAEQNWDSYHSPDRDLPPRTSISIYVSFESLACKMQIFGLFASKDGLAMKIKQYKSLGSFAQEQLAETSESSRSKQSLLGRRLSSISKHMAEFLWNSNRIIELFKLEKTSNIASNH